jgi:PAP2 superfamily
VPNLELSWQQAGVVACCLAAVAVALRLTRRPRLAGVATFTRESALVFGLFTLWQFAGSFSVMGPGGALARGRWIWHLERELHLPSEAAVQRLFLPHPLLVQAFNLYYDVLHFPVLIACLIWLFIWHRDIYLRRRTTLAALTGACLLVQLIPVAPPRMLPGTGMVDTAVLYHQSVYQQTAGFNPDQLGAMPSVHVGWAILVAIMVISAARSRWRWLVLLYPVVTTLAVIVTANHYWMDGIVAALILVVVLIVQTWLERLVAVHRAVFSFRLRLARNYRLSDPVPTGSADRDGAAAPPQDRTPARSDQPSLGQKRASLRAEAPIRNAAWAAGLSSMRQFWW